MGESEEAVASPRIALCICTRNRPEELQGALRAVRQSRRPIDEVIVADDSSDGRTRELIDGVEAVSYVRGPQRGLAANRNCALRHVTADLVMFLDDDARLDPSFTDAALAAYGREDGPSRVIVSGGEIKNGNQVWPHEQDFLGFQHREYRVGEPLRTVVINAALFPRSLFDVIRFDEHLRYGYEEVDISTRAVARGYRIVAISARNLHHPSPNSRADYARYADASRLYVTLKRYAVTERRWGLAIGYVIVAPAHLLLARVRATGVRGVGEALGALQLAATYLMSRRAR